MLQPLTHKDILNDLRRGPHTWVDCGDCTLATWRFGHGPDVVFVHGWPLSSATWRDYIAPMSKHFTCHILDLPAAGRSKWSKSTALTLRAQSNTLLRCINNLGIQHVAFVAHDSGGTIARLTAAQIPERVFGIAMGNTEISNHGAELLRRAKRIASVPGVGSLFWLSTLSQTLCRSKWGFGGCFEDPTFVDGPFTSWVIEPMRRSPKKLRGPLAIARALDWNITESLPEAHRALQCPTLLLWGDRDRFFFPLQDARDAPRI